jgi:hypothetical protein
MKLKLVILLIIIQHSYAPAQSIRLPVYFDISAMENLYQIDSLKNLFAEQGFLLVRESAVQMINNYESTIFFPLKQKQWYKFVFIGDISSRSFQQRLYDFEEKKVITINQKIKDAEANIVQFDYIPKFAEFHALRSLQINKTKKKVNGYFLLFRKIN